MASLRGRVPVPRIERDRPASHGRLLAATVLACGIAPVAYSAALTNELGGDAKLTVSASLAVGEYVRAGVWAVLNVAILNEGEPFDAQIRIVEKRADGPVEFLAAPLTRLATGRTALDVFFTPGGPAADTAIEIVRLDGVGAVFRCGLHRAMRYLSARDVMLLRVGTGGVPAVAEGPEPGPTVRAIEAKDLPAMTEAYGAVDVVALGDMPGQGLPKAQIEALVGFVVEGGGVELSLDALLLEGHIVKDGPTHAVSLYPAGTLHYHGFGWVVSQDAVAGPTEPFAPWAGRGGPQLNPWLDARAADELAPARPFAEASGRARTIVVVAALFSTVALALLLRQDRRIVAAAVAGAAVLWTAIAVLAWREPAGAARIVRARAFTADGCAEIVTDNAVLATFPDRERPRLSYETDLAPPLPVAHSLGEALSRSFRLEKDAGVWRLSRLVTRPGAVEVVRSRAARPLDDESSALRGRVLAEGKRVRVTAVGRGRRRLEPVGHGLAPDVAYLLRELAPPALPAGASEMAWLWIDGAPPGARAPGLDAAPGSGTLLVATFPPER